MEKKELYADGFGQIHFAGNMIRLDLVSLQPEEGKDAKVETTARVIMPPQGFLAAFDSMQKLIDKLVAAGVMKKAEPETKPTMGEPKKS